jgi:hypothetical protein
MQDDRGSGGLSIERRTGFLRAVLTLTPEESGHDPVRATAETEARPDEGGRASATFRKLA